LRYRLVVVTDGRPGYLERALGAFDLLARPGPAEAVIVDDSGDEHYRRFLLQLASDLPFPAAVTSHPRREGFCRTVAHAWTLAGVVGPEWIFWLEDDFELERAVELPELAHVLDHEARVAQMALYRNPVSDEEVAAGGYVPMRPGAYEPRGAGGVRWLEHTVCWTTNPSLFRASFARAYAWPRDHPECEGRFGFHLRELRPETTFGIWGAGEPWVRHFGVRSGTGY
jgi:hypothetical protein